MDVVKINVPTFIRLLELVREEIKNDPDLHDIAEIVTLLSQDGVITMRDYDSIVRYMETVGHDIPDDEQGHEDHDDELDDIKRLGGI